MRHRNRRATVRCRHPRQTSGLYLVLVCEARDEASSVRVPGPRDAAGGDRAARVGSRGDHHRRRAKPDAGARLPAGGAEPAGRSAQGSGARRDCHWTTTASGSARGCAGATSRTTPRLATAHPLLREAIAHVAHYQIRNRGTVGGSLAHADPAAELPGIAVTCDAEITLVGAAGARTINAADFFTGPLSTAAPTGRDHHRAAPAVLARGPALGFPGICAAAGRFRACRRRALL